MSEKSSQSIIAKNISRIKKKESYKPFEQGYFRSVPEMEGYIMKIEGPENPSHLVVNTASDFKYKRNFVKVDGHNFIIYNAPSLEDFLDNLTENMPDILESLKEMFRDYEDSELPRGYFRDENGEIKVDMNEATLVRKIFKQYTTLQSIRKVASSNKVDYSYVRYILHDDRYQNMPIKIIPDNDMKKVWQILQANRKNLYQKQDLKQSLKTNKLLKNKFGNNKKTNSKKNQNNPSKTAISMSGLD